MDVIFVPDYSGGNPYQGELAGALERRGIAVNMAIPGVRNLPFIGALRDHGVPDVLHIHWIYPFLIGRYRTVTVLKGTRLLLELLVLKFLGVRVVWTVHNLEDHEGRTPTIERYFRSIVARLCDDLIVHCSTARDRLVERYDLPERYRDRIEVLRHGHYIDSYPDEVSRQEARKRLDIETEATTFLYFGRIRAYKNLPGLIEAFGRLDGEDVELYVVGRPGKEHLDSELADLCQTDERVTYVPEFVPEDEIQLYMNAADAVVLPFSNVLSSGSAILAMSFGNPVLAPRIGCLEPLLAGQAELTYEPDDEDALVRALRSATTRDLESIGAGNRRRIEATRDWDDIAERTRTVYEMD